MLCDCCRIPRYFELLRSSVVQTGKHPLITLLQFTVDWKGIGGF